MRYIAPDYYGEFACLMGGCRHSCCVGWEIDIDEETLAYYRSVPGELGEELRKNIAVGEEGALFRLTQDERCPFLNSEGLCELIITLGPECLCQICDDHPRFRTFFSDREEIGLGLCCEAAGRLILGRKEKACLVMLDDDGAEETADEAEAELISLRDELIAIAQDRSLPVLQRVENILSAADIRLSFDAEHWAKFLLTLERLDEHWAELIKQLPHAFVQPLDRWLEVPLEQLICCLLYRHLPGALEDGDISGRIRFCALMWHMIARLCAQNACTSLDDLVELTRLYSSEIEYSNENTCAILDRIAQAYEGR